MFSHWSKRSQSQHPSAGTSACGFPGYLRTAMSLTTGPCFQGEPTCIYTHVNIQLISPFDLLHLKQVPWMRFISIKTNTAIKDILYVTGK